MHVVFCCYDAAGTISGPQTWLAELLPALERRGVRVTVIGLTWGAGEGLLLTSLRNHGIDCRVSPCEGDTAARIGRIVADVNILRPDIVVVNHVTPAWFAARWIQQAGIPCIGVLHSDDPFYRALAETFIGGPAIRAVDHVVAVSRALSEVVARQRSTKTQAWHVPYGVPVPSAGRQMAQHGLRVCYVGRFADEQKRITDVAAAMCRAAGEIDGLTGVLYGDGPQRAEVEAILEARSAGKRVVTGGCLTPGEVRARLMEHDVLLLLSDYEGLPIAVLEAMACGVVPVCLAMRSGIPELVEDEVTGIVVQDRGDSVVAALKRLSAEPELRERLSRAARARIIERYSVEAMADAWAVALGQIAPKAPPRHVRLPQDLALPTVHPDLACEDWRMPVRPFAARLRGHLKRLREILTKNS